MRIIAVCAGLGVAVGAVLLLVLRFLAGQHVIDGANSLAGFGAPRRYADYLPTGGGSNTFPHLLPVALGTGLVAGLLVGVLLRVLVVQRASGVGRALLTTALVLAGLVVGSLLATELHAYGRHAVTDFGWSSYSPITNATVGSDGILYGGGPGTGPWWPLVVTGAVVGLVVGVLAAGVVLVTDRRVTRRVRRA